MSETNGSALSSHPPAWQGLLTNLGEWAGSFMEFSAAGRFVKETPSHLNLSLSEDELAVSLCLRRFPPNQSVNEINFQFSYPGPGLAIPFFEQGAFSQGSLQHTSVTRFGAELAMIWGDRRVRLVEQFANGLDFSSVTVIGETRAGVPNSPSLTVADLCGHWQGHATTLFANGHPPQSYDLSLSISQVGDRLKQSLQFQNQFQNQFQDQQIQTEGQIHGNKLEFSSGPQPLQLLLLPAGASCLCPQRIERGVPFFLEAGWLIEANLRQRLIRSYNDKGEWVSLTHVVEHKQSSEGTRNGIG